MKRHLIAFCSLAALSCSCLCVAHAADGASSLNPVSYFASAAEGKAEGPAAPQKEGSVQLYEPKAELEASAARKNEILGMLEGWRRLKPGEAASRHGINEQLLSQRVETLVSLSNAYSSIGGALRRKVRIDDELAAVRSETDDPVASLTLKPPFRLQFHDDSIDELEELRKHVENAKNRLERASLFVEASQAETRDREAAWRLSRDKHAQQSSAETAWSLSEAALQLEKARANLVAAQIDKTIADSTLVICNLKYERQAKLRSFIRDNLDLQQASFEAQLKDLAQDARNLELEAQRAEKRGRYQQNEEALKAVQGKLASAAGKLKELAQYERDMLTSTQLRINLELDHLQGQQLMYAARRRMWTMRFDLSRNAVDEAKIPAIVRELEDETRSFAADTHEVNKTLMALQNRYAAVQKQLAALPAGGQAATVLKKDGAIIQSAIDECLTHASKLFSMSAQGRILAADLDERYGVVPFWEKALEWWRTSGVALLNVELWQTGDYAVRLKEFVLAFALMLLGTWAVQRILIPLILWLSTRRTGMDETSRRSLSRILFFIAVVGIFLGALRIVGIPLAAFAFLGGTLAIAIGFGAQNLFKNLISGILLTIKRPFRIGNIIEVGDINGVVSDIGFSVTIIRTFDEKEVIIPNSDLLEKQVVNWSLSDALLRYSVSVGVEYDTPAERVRKALLDAAASYPMALKSPEPWVCFDAFGDSSLDFTLYFWINLRQIARLRAGSEMRMLIQKKFREEGIPMAYPHMDVTLLGDKARRLGDPACAESGGKDAG